MRGSLFSIRLPLSILALSLAGGLAAGAQAQSSRVAATGDPAPGLDGAFFNDFFPPNVSVWGYAVFKATVIGRGAADDEGIWLGFDPDRLFLVALEGQQAPGTVAGALFDGFSSPVINDNVEVAFRGSLSGNVSDENNSGIWAGSPDGVSIGGIELLAREGDQAPDAPGAFFESLREGTTFSFNNSSEIAFLAGIDGEPEFVDVDTDQGIWSGGGALGRA